MANKDGVIFKEALFSISTNYLSLLSVDISIGCMRFIPQCLRVWFLYRSVSLCWSPLLTGHVLDLGYLLLSVLHCCHRALPGSSDAVSHDNCLPSISPCHPTRNRSPAKSETHVCQFYSVRESATIILTKYICQLYSSTCTHNLSSMTSYANSEHIRTCFLWLSWGFKPELIQ